MRRGLRYLDFGVVLAVALQLPVAGFGVVTKDDLLPVARLFYNRAGNLRAGDVRRADLNVVPVDLQENLVERNSIPFRGDYLFHFYFLPGGNFVLLPAGLYDCEAGHNITNGHRLTTNGR
mgnify:FL=1